MKKTKPPLFSHAQILGEFNEKIGSLTIQGAIDGSCSIIHTQIFEIFFEKYDYLKLLNEIREAISEPVLQAKLVESWESEVNEYNEEISLLLRDAQHISLYIEMARAAEIKKEHNRAWAFINYASQNIGEILVRAEIAVDNLKLDKRSKQNSKNAQERNKKLLPIKKEAARLIEEMKPKDGWLTKTNAVTTLERPIADFIEEKAITIVSTTNLERLLTKWLREEEILCSAWEKSNRSQQPSKASFE